MKFFPQHDQMDCGPSCLAMICSYYGRNFDLPYLRGKCFIARDGVSLLGLSEAAENVGLNTVAAKLELNDFQGSFDPCILHWNQNHFVVLYKISVNIFNGKRTYKLADPAYGFVALDEHKFEKSWLSDGKKGVVLFLEPTERFYTRKASKIETPSLGYLLKYLKPHKKQLKWMFVFLLLGALTSLVFPVLTQKLIDDGVNKKNISTILYILFAQLSFFFGNIIFSIFRNWIMLTLGTSLNIKIISDFLEKLLKLPMNFFDNKLMGDLSQRIQDHERIELFLTSKSILTLFSMITFSVFFGVLWYYDYRILAVYIVLTIFSIVWSLLWMKKGKKLDYFKFQVKSENQESVYEMINNISELKLNQFEDFKCNQWKTIQQRLFEINIRLLKVDEIQFSGYEFINQFKNIVVTFLSASFVVKGHMTLGALLSVSYIIGQMNTPVSQLIGFFQSLQDAKLSLARLNEVQNHPKEEKSSHMPLMSEKFTDQNCIEKGIYFKDVSFQYEGPQSPYVLKNITLFIPEGKITAIVGASGSGKTTLLKILLKFYEPVSGCIYFNHLNLKDISPTDLRKNCGVVMQDGSIFSDSIERNIATGDEYIDNERLYRALETANIKSFVKEQPLGLLTKIGASGNSISGGEKQRILIARAIYKNPRFIFLDEASSALDTENEKIIHDNLQYFLQGKTGIIIAHRLSTVRNADQIVVLKNGEIVESGKHQELVSKKAIYYQLIKNQLELGD